MHRLADPILIALERLWQHRILVFWTLVGLSAATTLALSLTLYVDAVNTNLLTDNLDEPPYAFRFRYLGSWEGNIATTDVERASTTIQQEFVQAIGLPTISDARYLSAGSWTVRREQSQFGVYTLGTLEGTAAQMQIVAGEWPPTETSAHIPVLISANLFYTTGLQVGDTLSATRPGGQTVQVEVAALWQPVDPDDPAWILTPKFFDQVLLMQLDDFWQITAGNATPIEEADWHIIFDGSELRTSDVSGLLEAIVDGQRMVEKALPGVRLDISPQDGLETFSEAVSQLTQQLVIVILPVAGLILYFVTMLSGMLVGRQRQEDITISNRGMSRRGLLGLHTLMWLMLAGIALLIGIALAPSVVMLVGRTTSFLRFDGDASDLSIVFTQQTLVAGAATGLLAASSGLLMAWRTTGQSIVSFKQSEARASKAWWQRLYLDVMLLVPAAYLYYTLSAEGGLVTEAEEPFSDPLVFLAPTFFSLGATLVFLRIYPFVLNISSRLIAFSSSIVLLMALRELTRSIGRYRSTLLMMTFTLSLIGFTASMASTLDRSLEDVINYRIGADSVLIIASDAQMEESTADDGSTTLTVVGYNTLPASELLQIESIDYASRVGRYQAQIQLSRQRLSGIVIGVDRGSMAAIANFRDDYADEPLADLLNRLAGNRTGVILNQQFADTYDLVVGQDITLQLLVLNTTYTTTVPIVGVMDYFPTLDPRDGFFAITNLDPIFELVGTELPHDMWLSVNDLDAAQAAVAATGYPVLDWRSPEEDILAAQAAPARRGILGFLSIGFVSAIALTLVGSVIQSTASFRTQSIQIGSLRAMGLGGGAVAMYLLFSQGIAAIGGVLGGTFIGITTTNLYLPLLDFSGGLPPYLVRVAWDDITLVYSLFAAVLFVVTLLTTAMLGRQTVSTLVKLGDA